MVLATLGLATLVYPCLAIEFLEARDTLCGQQSSQQCRTLGEHTEGGQGSQRHYWTPL